MTNASNQLDNVMAAAEAAAANYVPAVPAIANNDNTIGIVNTGGGGGLARPSAESAMDSAGMTVDEYLTMKQGGGGFKIGKDMKGLLEELVVEIDLDDVAYIWSCRSELNGATTFIKSYDGLTTSTGANFSYDVQRLKNVPGAKTTEPYQTAEIPATLVSDVEDPKKDSNVVIHEGATVGITPSMTGFKEFQKFLKKLRRDNPDALRDTVRVKLTSVDKTNSKNNTWGVLQFELAE